MTARGIVGVGQKNHGRTVGNPLQQGRKVNIKAVEGHHYRHGTHGPHRYFIHEEGRQRHQGLVPPVEKPLGHQGDDIIGTVADNHVLRCHSELFRQSPGQHMSAAVGIAVHGAQMGLDSIQGHWRRSQGIFVGGELHGIFDAVLPLNGLDGPTRFIGFYGVNVRRDIEFHGVWSTPKYLLRPYMQTLGVNLDLRFCQYP